MNWIVSIALLLQTMSMMTKISDCLPLRAAISRNIKAASSLHATNPDIPSKRRFSAWGEGSDIRSSSDRSPGRNIDGGEYNSGNSVRNYDNTDRGPPRERNFGGSDRGTPRDTGGRGRGGTSYARTTYQRDDPGGNSYNRGSNSGYQGNSYNRDNMNEENREPPCGYFDGDHLYGISPIRLAVASGRRNITELLIQEGMELSNKKDEKSAFEILKIAKEKGIPIREFPKHDLNMLTENRPHQGFVLRAAPLQFTRLDSLPMTENFQCVLALDEVWDPQNFGALLRTSHFLGVDKVVVCAKNSAPLSPTVSKASSGALEIIEVSSTDNMMRFLDKSMENGWQVILISIHIPFTFLSSETTFLRLFSILSAALKRLYRPSNQQNVQNHC